MLIAAKPGNELIRIQTLQALNILDTEPEERFDRMTRLARRLFEVSIACVALVDDARLWVKSYAGTAVAEMPRAISFCSHAILGDDVLLVADALHDARFHDNPLVSGSFKVRFYAGMPLTAGNGCKLGTLCLFDVVPRTLDQDDCALLGDLAKMAEQELNAIHLATMDELTLISNRRGFNNLAQYALNLCRRVERSAMLFFFDLDQFKEINDTFGHAEGDYALRKFAQILRQTFRESDVVGRLGGDEFVVLSTNSDLSFHEAIVARLRRTLEQHNRFAARNYNLEFSVGVAQFDSARHDHIDQLLGEADRLMYANKQARRDARFGSGPAR